MKRKRMGERMPAPDLSSGPFESQVPDKPKPPKGPSPIGYWGHNSGSVRETCSCGATIETPATADGREAIADWRHMHRHTPAAAPEQDKPNEPDTLPATGELRNETRVFGFFPPTVGAQSSAGTAVIA